MELLYSKPQRIGFELAVAEFSGQTQRSLEIIDEVLSYSDHIRNVCMCVPALINAGRYQRALDISKAHDTPSEPWALVQVNLAEAEYNLGRWEDGLARLDRMRSLIRPDPNSNAGGLQQRAWILAHLGRHPEAWSAAAAVRLEDLARIYHAEHHYTLAHIALTQGDARMALAYAESGLRVARRASSLRNGALLRARSRAALGETSVALAEFERAAAMPYRAQGGGGLLAWGDLLRSLGREEEARRAFTWAVERDLESEAARIAEKRLVSSA
jgi:tetratricopeptide (TPR) repeat protein